MTARLNPRLWSGETWGVVSGYFFVGAWLVFLVFPIRELLDSHPPAAVVAGSLIAVGGFVAVYLWFWIRVRMGVGRPGAGAVVAAVGLLLISVPMTLADANRWFNLYIYVVVATGAGLRLGRAIPAVAAITAVAAAVAAVSRAPGAQITAVAVQLVLVGLSSAVIARLIGTVIELRMAREEIAKLAVAEERLRFARDLHDLLGHSLSVIVLKAELAGKLGDRFPARSAAEVADIERVARDALREVRDAVSGYREPTLDQELEGTRSVLTSAGITAGFRRSAPDLPAAIESILAWVVREGVTNVIRHSRAAHCSVLLEPEAEGVRLAVEDDGAGCLAVTAGSGLRGIRERVEARGGRVEAGPLPDRGFRLAVWLPV